MRDAASASRLRLERWSLAALATWLLGSAALVWLLLIYPNQVVSGSAKDMVIALPHEATLAQYAEHLAKQGVIRLPRAFVMYIRLLGAEARLRHGDVVVNRALSPRGLLPRIADGFGNAIVRVAFPEGFTRFDVARRLARFGICSEAEFERDTRNPTLLAELQIDAESAEGYLFPATYQLAQGGSCRPVLREMVRVFRERTRERFARYEREHDGAPFSLAPHEIVILASLVEREARMADERARIAGVFMNRLTSPDFRPKRLQSDPTVAYGCLVEPERIPSCATYDGRRVTPEMVRDPDNRFSTYRHEGLPPSPICNPGLAAIDAALSPETHDFFYFVTSGGGRHAFTRTLEEHNQRVRGAP